MSVPSLSAFSTTMPVNTGATVFSSDPQVHAAIEGTLATPDMTHAIDDVMNDPSLTQEQKDEYISTLIRLASDSVDGDGPIPPETAAGVIGSLRDIGNAYTGVCTPELRQQVTDSIARGVADGHLDSDDIYGIVRHSPTSGIRELLTGIGDGHLLADVSERLVADASEEGYDPYAPQGGVMLLTAAADIANMAAENGNSRAADIVLAEIDRVSAGGPIGDGVTLVQAMMAQSLENHEANSPERTGFYVLAGLLHTSSPESDGAQIAQDRLFAELVRSSGDYPGGIDQNGDVSGALDLLGEYFEANLPRLSETDWRMRNTTDDFNHRLMADFFRFVMLDPRYGRVDQTSEAIADEINRQAAVVGDPDLPIEERTAAANTLGAIMGSVEWATEDFIRSAEGSAEAQVSIVRFFTDKLTNHLIGQGSDRVPEGGLRNTSKDAANNFVDQIWQSIEDRLSSGERERGTAVTFDIIELSRIVRTVMSDDDAGLLNAFDDRRDTYADPD